MDIFGDPLRTIASTKDKEAVLPYPHYTDARFARARTVFGDPAESEFGHHGLTYVYTDRLIEWDRAKAEHAAKVAKASGFAPWSAGWYEAYLCAYEDRKVTIEHVMVGFNVSNGYPYAVLGYRA